MKEKSNASFKIPATMGRMGLPPKVGSGSLPKGISSPVTSGSRGKPHNKKAPGTPAARD